MLLRIILHELNLLKIKNQVSNLKWSPSAKNKRQSYTSYLLVITISSWPGPSSKKKSKAESLLKSCIKWTKVGEFQRRSNERKIKNEAF